jgi:hypothetical protein
MSSVVNPEGRGPLLMNRKATECESVGWIHLAEDRFKCHARVCNLNCVET